VKGDNTGECVVSYEKENYPVWEPLGDAIVEWEKV